MRTTKRWCDKNGIDLKDCYFYTDSMSDVKLLENVGYPVCVNPDSRLKKHATERGWPTVDWGTSESVLKSLAIRTPACRAAPDRDHPRAQCTLRNHNDPL